MKKILNILFSNKASLIFLITFAIGMAVATFIEEKFDTATAKEMVYNAKWFEFTLLMLALNFIGNINRYNLFRLQKAGSLTFHIAFILLIIGAGLTRYVGSEGTMHIREGQSSNIIYDSEPNLLVKIGGPGEEQTSSKAFQYSKAKRNNLKMHINSNDAGSVQIELKQYVKNAIEKIVENVEGGENIIELSLMTGRQRETLYISKGERKQIGNKIIVFGEITENDDFGISDINGSLNLKSSHDITRTDMHSGIIDSISNGLPVQLENNYIYQSHELMFVLKNVYSNSIKKLVSSNTNELSSDAMILDVTIQDVNYEAQVYGGPGFRPVYQDFNFGGTQIAFAFGNKPIKLDFSLFLEDFILERYPGSHSPSSFESHVIVIDPRINLRRKEKIFMNNVLDYGGYRFFQSSYDPDEKGTVLSVNHDRLGTFVTYVGYFLLALGFILTPFSKRSRIQSLMKNIRETRIKRKALLLMLMFFGVNSLVFSQVNEQNPVQPEHAEKFGQLITISYEGRFLPIHTLANDVMHKISRKDEFDTEGKSKMNARQVFLDMLIDSEYWQQQNIIYVREKSVRDVLGIQGKHASYNDFFNQQHNYKLREFVDNAFRKQPATQTKFDKEIIKVDERINICYMVFQGTMMKIFPEQGSDNNNWLSWTDSLAFKPLTGAIQGINEDLQLDQFSYYSLFQKYIIELKKSTNTGDYERSDQILSYIANIQRQLSPKEHLPSESKINTEIYYNESNIFIKLKNIYGLLSIILIGLAFIDNLGSGRSKFIRYPMAVFISLLGLAFLYHTFGMGIRWYLTGHAPWSNGYEALILISWAGLFAGFSFIRSSKLSLAATALFAFFALMTASHSSYDPQLTNLQPVLKSYWLIFHVATITISYGFFGLAFMLGIINMFLNLLKTSGNSKRIGLIIEELSSINELNLIIGVILATAGTFLGGIWANESWGRYWGWDAKETWSLIIIISYTIILHTRLIPGLKKSFVINAGAIIGFGSVLMTFIGVNYYFSKGLHSYASGDTPIFPIWAWALILSLILLMVLAGLRDWKFSKMKE